MMAKMSEQHTDTDPTQIVTRENVDPLMQNKQDFLDPEIAGGKLVPCRLSFAHTFQF
jgi:hypothetical protein